MRACQGWAVPTYDKPARWGGHPHFTEEETEAQVKSAGGHTGILPRAVRFQSLASLGLPCRATLPPRRLPDGRSPGPPSGWAAGAVEYPALLRPD